MGDHSCFQKSSRGSGAAVAGVISVAVATRDSSAGAVQLLVGLATGAVIDGLGGQAAGHGPGEELPGGAVKAGKGMEREIDSSPPAFEVSASLIESRA
jgi:hypothetical protein